MRIKVGQIWEGYKESPCDFYNYNKLPNIIRGNQKVRPFLILKVNNDGTARVSEGSNSIKNKYWERNVYTSNNEKYSFDIGSVYNLPINNIKFFKYDFALNDRVKYLEVENVCNQNYFRHKEKSNYEKKLQSGELLKMPKRQRKYERTHKQFSKIELSHIYNPNEIKIRKAILESKKELLKQNSIYDRKSKQDSKIVEKNFSKGSDLEKAIILEMNKNCKKYKAGQISKEQLYWALEKNKNVLPQVQQVISKNFNDHEIKTYSAKDKLQNNNNKTIDVDKKKVERNNKKEASRER